MKRKLLATLLALCLIVGMIPVAASAGSMTDCPGDDTCTHAAAIGNTHYGTLQEAITAASPGQTIKLCNDINPSQPIEVSKTLTLDLAGHKISNTSPIWDGSKKHWSLIRVAKEGNLTLTGNGILEALQDDCYAVDLYDTDSNCTIEDGTFIGNVHAVYVFAGNLTVNGGTFSVKQKYSEKYPYEYVLNCYDDNYKNETASITVNGGIFQGFNPQDCRAEGEGTNFCSDKCIVTSEEKDGITTYTVAPVTAENAVAQVEGDYFASLDSAFAAAEEGSTVQLLRNTTYNNRINVEKDVILDLGGYTLTSETSHSFVVYPSKSFTIQNGTIRNTIGTVVFVLKGSTITLDENATLECKDGVSGTNNTDEEGGATFNIYGDIQSTDIAVWIQGPKNTVNIDGADLSANYFAVYQNGSFGGNTYTIRNSTIFNGEEAGPAIYISNSKTNTENENQGWQTLTVEDSTITGPSGIEVKFTNATIRNSTITATAEEPTFDQYNNGSTSGGFAVVATDNTMEPNDPAPEGIIEINGGYYSGLVGLGSIVDLEEYPDFKETTYEIHSGYFTSDPSEYLAEGKVAVESDEPGYNYMVAEANTEAPAEVVTAEPDANVSESITREEDKEAAEAIQSALDANVVSGDGLTAAANTVAKNNTVTTNPEVLKQLNKVLPNGSEEATADNTTIVIQPYMDISIDAVDMAAKTVTLDITPMYRTVATTAKLESGQIILDSKDSGTVNAVQIGDPRPLEINKPVTITLTLPANFATSNETLYIQHIKDGGRTYYYTGTVDTGTVDSKNLTFTNPNGFSTFTVSTTNGAVAEVEGIGYANFQDAVDAVENGGTIEVLKSGDYSVSGNKTFSITYGAGIAVTLKAATGYVLTQEGNNTYTIAYAGGGTPSEPEEPTWPFTDVTEGDDWFYDAVAYVYENGIMAGTDETTFEPTMELDRAMAAQLFYNLEGKPAVTGDSTFTDVTSGHWAVDAITWAAQNDIVAGIGGGLYDPDSNVTREQFAVMLYKYARFKGYDLTATGDLTQFPDAGSISSWAETALSWANGNGLINGHENGTIDPKGSTIRAQAASIMANFDQNVAK